MRRPLTTPEYRQGVDAGTSGVSGQADVPPVRRSWIRDGLLWPAFVAFLKRYVYVAIRCLYLLTLGPFSRANRKRLERLGRTLGYGGPKPQLPPISLRHLVGHEFSVRIVEPDTADWNVDLVELLAINAIVARFAPRGIFEIGTYDGRTTLNLAANAPAGSTVYTLDLPPGSIKMPKASAAGERFRGTPYQPSIEQLYGNSLSYDFSRYHGMIDLVFVDASHHYEHVANDTRKALELIQGRQGIILWHDYGFEPGVTRAVNELFTKLQEVHVFAVIDGTRLACLITGPVSSA